MKKILSFLILAVVLAMASVTAYADEPNIYDDCADFGKAVQKSEGLALDVVTEENKYAFSGDDTHIIRVTSEAEWLVYEVSSDGYFVFNTAFSPNEAISDFTFEYSSDGESWTLINPITTVDSVDGGKWITVHYSLKKLSPEAKYVRITFGNIGGTPWSPCIESVELRPYNTQEIGFLDCVGTEYYASTAKLKNLGLISGYSDTEFSPDGDITRAEFCSMMARLLNLSGALDPSAFEKVFNDIDSDFWGAGAVYALYSIGAINGDENGNFNPDDNISLQDAVKIMVSSLGYTAMAEELGGYPNGFMTMASRLNLLGGLTDAEFEDSLCRGDAAVLMDNGLDAELVYQTSFGNTNTYDRDGSTILNRYHDIYEVSGVVTDVGYATVFSEGSAQENRFVIDGVSYKIGDFDVMPYLGMSVCAYVKKDSNNEYTALYIEPGSDTAVREFGSDKYLRIDGGSLYYSDESGGERRVSVNENTKIIYNYKYLTRIGIDEIPDTKSGFFKIVTNGGGAADYIFIYDYDTYFVTGSASLGGTFNDMFSGAVNLGLENADLIMLQNDGEVIEYTSDYRLNKNDAVSVAKSADGRIADIRISIDSVIGSVSNIDLNSGECIINGEVYELSEYFKSSGAEAEPSQDIVTAYLDINSKIVYISESTRSLQYGYLKKVSSSADAFGSSVSMQIVTESGSAQVINATSKSALNGSVSALDSFLRLMPQLVMFSLRSDGTLAQLYTAEDLIGTINADGFARSYVSASSKFYDTLNIFASKYQLTSDTKVFIVPEDSEDISGYKVTDYTALRSDTAYNVQLFDLDAEYNVGAAVITKPEDSDVVYNNSPVYIVADSGTVLDDDGNRCLYLRVMSGGAESELLFDSDGANDCTNGWIPGYTERETKNGNNPFSAGDVLQVNIVDGKCAAFRVMLTASMIHSDSFYERNLGDFGALSEELYYSELYTAFGTVSQKLSSKLIFSPNTEQTVLRTVPIGSAVYVYDRRSRLVMPGDASDIETGMPVFVQFNYGTVNTILAVRN